MAHYAERGEAARDARQDRVMERDSHTVEELIRLHGELPAHRWIELNVSALVGLDEKTHGSRNTPVGRMDRPGNPQANHPQAKGFRTVPAQLFTELLGDGICPNRPRPVPAEVADLGQLELIASRK
jgi:hypothetical protein